MRQATILLTTIFLIFFSCKKEVKSVAVHEKVSCDFGIKEFNYTKRTKAEINELNKRTKPPHPTHPHDTIVDPPPPPPPPPPSGYSGILLVDFDGGFVNDPNWGTFTVAGSGLADAQKAEILSSVEFDYSAFNVLVTTDENIYNSFTGNKNTCFVTESYEWYGSAGGVAFIGSFTTSQSPCFVFSLLLNYNTKFIKEAVSHEIGHTLGLYHQSVYDSLCNKLSEYNSGCCGQAPIMGIGYYQPNVHWWTSCEQNDSLFIKNLVGLR